MEGGAQVRVTPQGFQKLTSILPGALNSSLGGGFCVPDGSFGDPTGFLGTGAEWCYTNANGCNPGCKANVSINNNGFSLSVTNQNTIHVALSTSANASIPIKGQVVGIGASCTLTATSNNLNGAFDVALGIDATTGELTIHLAQIESFQLNMNFSGCSLLSDIANLASSIIDSFVGQFVIQLLTPALDNLIQGLLPNPLGIAGEIDVGALLAGVSPGTQAEMEARIVPGGYVSLLNQGLSLGVITGVNSDIDPSTRVGTRGDGVPYASEPSLCVPPLKTPDFGAPPFSLPTTSRGTFALNVATAFDGSMDPANVDLTMGLSQTTLDQLGHHAVTSGAMCLGVGTSFIKQLNVGTIGILVPSLNDLTESDNNAPLLLVTRPQREITFTIGDNTMQSPALTVGISHMEVDFYAFLFERYVRAFTLDLTLNVGVNLTFDQQPGMPATITPSIVGLSSSNVQLTVLNSEFVRESPQHLEMVLPSVFDLITPLLGNLQPITVPSFAGFSLNNLSIQHVTTPQDDFLALYAQLGASTMMRQLAMREPLARDAVDALDAKMLPTQPKSTGSARLVSVDTPPPQTIIDGLKGLDTGKLPTLTFDVDHVDSLGRELEWTWNFDGGMWHQFTSDFPLVIADRAFAWQGKYTIGLKSRVKGDYRTTSDVLQIPVVIDSVGPKVFTDKAQWNGDVFSVPVWDVVSGDAVKVGFGAPGDDQPRTTWMDAKQATLNKADYDLFNKNGEVVVFAKDEQGNQTIALIAPFHGTSGTTGCTCETGRPGAGGIATFAVVGLLVLRRRRRRGWLRRIATRRNLTMLGMWAGAIALSSLVPSCSCSSKSRSCEMMSDCDPSQCMKGQLPFCIDNTCVCSDDVPIGQVGPYSDIAAAPDGTQWVSAYAQTYGDLVVTHILAPGRVADTAWEWVDGVPAGPVVVPGSMIRGGIADNGPDVGMYTSIAVAPDGTPMVSYFDVDNASLKFAAKVNGTWQIHTVDAGTGMLGNGTGSLVGMYTSITLRGDDGRPGIAYLAHVEDASGEHAEVRYASAQVAIPMQASDWQFWTVDTGMVPPDDPSNPNIYPLPEGLGLFIDSARDPRTQAPIVTYYDRGAAELKLAKFNPTSGQFDPAIVLDGGNGTDDGWNPSLQVDANGVSHVTYIDATTDDLKYVVEQQPIEIVDDGYRIVGQTVDGLPKPTEDMLADTRLVLPPGNADPLVVYQDSTTQELLLATRSQNGMWSHVSVAGNTNPWPGAYGFFAKATLSNSNLVMSNWVVDLPTNDNWVEVFANPVAILQ
ncbi:MAG TPA: hypothetical protein VLX92_02450 [Kofleriaceae bacterium]|nr:hypothetical protein [Kofleriaceae bacterium]